LLFQIDESFERKSVVLACKRFKGSHTYDKIADLLDEISSSVGLQTQQITATVTDNASNFCKAFRTFNVDVARKDEDIAEARQDGEENDDSGGEDDVKFVSASELSLDSDVNYVKLPNHRRCACHTLSLVCTTDAKKALKTVSFSKINHTTMGKCTALWTNAGRPKSSESIQEILGQQLRIPCPTRWNSLYDSLVTLNSNKEEINLVMSALQLPQFKETELQFIYEYCTVLRPIAQALDRLQGDKNCYYGELLPTLLSTHTKLAQLESEDSVRRLRHCMPLVHAVSNGFKERFSDFLNLSPLVTDAVMASVSHPFFKLRWTQLLPGSVDEKSLQDKFVHAISLREKLRGASEDQQQHDSFEDQSDAFFLLSRTNSSSVSDGAVEALNYLQDQSRDLASLNRYPLVKKVFIEYNTTLPSSAPVERLFSFAGMVHSPKRNRLSDELFENLLLLKGNSGF
jgi:hypothetical protein